MFTEVMSALRAFGFKEFDFFYKNFIPLGFSKNGNPDDSFLFAVLVKRPFNIRTPMRTGGFLNFELIIFFHQSTKKSIHVLNKKKYLIANQSAIQPWRSEVRSEARERRN